MDLNLPLKIRFHHDCIEILQRKVGALQDAIEQAQSAANLETKSSAGDKYETGRAMMHIEKDKLTMQLAAGFKLLELLNQIPFDKAFNSVKPGALLETSQGLFYCCVSLGECQFESHTIQTISLRSPLGQQFRNHKIGDTFEFRSVRYELLNII